MKSITEIMSELKFDFPYSEEEWIKLGIPIENYHKHTTWSNPIQRDCVTTTEDMAKMVLNRNGKCLFSGEHGYQGSYLKVYDVANEKGLKFVYSVEAYWVKDRFSQDRSNCHIILVARTMKGIEDLNYILSLANEEGYYYKARIDLELIKSLSPEDVYITSSCVAGWKYEDAEEIWLSIHKQFEDSFFLEVQYHHTDKQKELNSKVCKLAREHNIQLIAGLDTHYLNDEEKNERDNYLEQNGIKYEDEDGWFMDFPTGKETYRRFKEQDVLSHEEILKAMMNTHIFTNGCDDIEFDRSFKIPSIYPDKSKEERKALFLQLLKDRYDMESYKSQEKYDGMMYEYNEIIGCDTEDYFMLNDKIIKDGINKYGGVLTTTSRGSAASFIVSKLLGFTTIDRFTSDIPMYPQRFLTKDRILKSKQLPDIDSNVSSQEPFIIASKDIVGEHGCYPLVAWGQLKEKSAWKMFADLKGVAPQVANDVSKAIDRYNMDLKHADDDDKDLINIEDYIPLEYVDIYNESIKYQGIVDNARGHACFHPSTLVMTSEGYKRISDVNSGDMVIGHDNEFHEVVRVLKKESDNECFVSVTGEKISTTKDHMFYVRTKEKTTRVNGKQVRPITSPYWKKASDLKENDFIGYSINQESRIPNNMFEGKKSVDVENNIYFDDISFWWFLGRYIGDGWTEKPKNRKNCNKVVICCNKKGRELEDIKKNIPQWIKYGVEEANSTYKVNIYNKQLYDYLQKYGKYAHGKKIHSDVLNLPKNFLNKFLEGYFSADGHLRDGVQFFTTVNKELAYGIQACVHKVYNMPCTINVKEAKEEIICGRKVNSKRKYICRFKYEKRKQDQNFYKDGIMWIRVKNIEIKESYLDVYDLSVVGSNSYTANNAIVHNCGFLTYQGDIRRKCGLIRCVSESTGKHTLCTVIDGSLLDSFGFVKNDWLIVSVVDLIDRCYKSVGQKVPTFDELRDLIDNDESTWDIYAKGATVGVNQCERDKTTQRIMKYKPRTLEEISSFVAAIRPSFQSLLGTFIDRKPYTTGERKVDELLDSSAHFMLYQESLMKIFAWLGVDMGECYDIIKSISKKKLKGKKLADFEAKLRENWLNNVGNLDNFDSIFQVIKDSANYAFNSPHAYAVAGDSAYVAYFKSHCTSKFYEVYLNYYMEKKNKDKVSAALNEAMTTFGYKMGTYQYGKDNSKFTVDDENKIIYPNLSSVKGFGDKVVIDLMNLYNLGKRNIASVYSSIQGTAINKTHIRNLIRIRYFKEFGEIDYLLKIVDILDEVMGCKQISEAKSKKIGYDMSTLSQFGKISPSGKTIKDIDDMALLKFLISKVDYKADNGLDIMKYQNDILGFIDHTDNTFSKSVMFIQNIEVNQWGTPFFTLYRVNDGAIAHVKVNKKFYIENKVEKNDVIALNKVSDVEKKRKDEHGKYIGTGEYEKVLMDYSKVESF